MGSLIHINSSDAKEQQQQLAEIEEIMRAIAKKLGIMGYPKRRLVLKSKQSLELVLDFLDVYRVATVEKHVLNGKVGGRE